MKLTLTIAKEVQNIIKKNLHKFRIGKYEDLNKKYMKLESRSTRIVKEESKRKGFEAVEAELAIKENEIKIMRIKLDKEREKVKYLEEKLAAMEKHKDQIDANNATFTIQQWKKSCRKTL
jgi:predicted RNase H-like nuclease (RuvC/YqgF family)